MDKREEFNEMRLENGLFKRKKVSNEDYKKYQELIDSGKELPNNIKYDIYMGGFYEKELKTNFTEKEIFEYIGYKQIKLLSTIKNCVLFFVVCYILSLIFQIIASLSINL